MERIATREDWLKAREALLQKERALTRLRDEVAAQRRALPWVKLDKDYVFESAEGETSLSEIFAGARQLVLYHFMLGPDWSDPCKSCSFWAEHFDAIRVHAAHRDVELVAVSRAPVAKIAELQSRFGWRFPWYSSLGSDFNFDFGVSFEKQEGGPAAPNYNFGMQSFGGTEAPGLSVFAKDEAGQVFHSYSTYARGLDALNGTYQILDLVPKGRDEAGLPFSMAWLRLKDKYE